MKQIEPYRELWKREEQDNKELREILEYKDQKIERLNKGYCELKEKCNKGECDCTHEEYNNMCEQNIKMDLEIERLNNIIIELEKFIDEEYRYYNKRNYPTFGACMGALNRIKDKLQELKGSDKE